MLTEKDKINMAPVFDLVMPGFEMVTDLKAEGERFSFAYDAWGGGISYDKIKDNVIEVILWEIAIPKTYKDMKEYVEQYEGYKDMRNDVKAMEHVKSCKLKDRLDPYEGHYIDIYLVVKFKS